jgi:hypothetical protein
MGEAMEKRLLPDVHTSLVTVEVYLPKNLRNYGALIELLSETLEFVSAKKWMLANMDTYREMHELIQHSKEPGRVGPFYMSEESYDAVRADGSENFETWVAQMERTIFGYSVYEVDGAFESLPRGRVVPIGKRWDVDIDEGVISCFGTRDLSPCLEVLRAEGLLHEGLRCTLPADHAVYLQTGPVAPEFVLALNSNGCEMESDYEFFLGDSQTWMLRRTRPSEPDHPERVLVIESRDSQLAVYEFKVTTEGDDGAFGVFAGSTTFWIGRREGETRYQRCPAVRLLEERTCVIRFMAEIRAETSGLNVLQQPLKAKGGGVCFNLKDKKLWDTIVLLGYYFVYNLGARVGIEDEIWMVYNDTSEKWAWKKGLLQKERC